MPGLTRNRSALGPSLDAISQPWMEHLIIPCISWHISVVGSISNLQKVGRRANNYLMQQLCKLVATIGNDAFSCRAGKSGKSGRSHTLQHTDRQDLEWVLISPANRSGTGRMRHQYHTSLGQSAISSTSTRACPPIAARNHLDPCNAFAAWNVAGIKWVGKKRSARYRICKTSSHTIIRVCNLFFRDQPSLLPCCLLKKIVSESPLAVPLLHHKKRAFVFPRCPAVALSSLFLPIGVAMLCKLLSCSFSASLSFFLPVLLSVSDTTALSDLNFVGSSFGVPGNNVSFDYIIAGGGTAGLVVAARLAQNASNSVAVIEAGGFYEVDNGNLSVVPGTDTYFAGADPDDTNPLIDWGFVTAPQPVSKLSPS